MKKRERAPLRANAIIGIAILAMVYVAYLKVQSNNPLSIGAKAPNFQIANKSGSYELYDFSNSIAIVFYKKPSILTPKVYASKSGIDSLVSYAKLGIIKLVILVDKLDYLDDIDSIVKKEDIESYKDYIYVTNTSYVQSLFGVISYPQYYLIDKNKIVRKNPKILTQMSIDKYIFSLNLR